MIFVMADIMLTPAIINERTNRIRTAQRDWQQRSVSQRLTPVKKLRRLLVTECDNLCEAVRRDFGKPLVEAIGGDILPTADACRFLEKEAVRLLKPRRVPRSLRPLWLWGQADTVYRRPRGVVGIIGTWNYPIFVNGVQLVQALVAGNGVLWKPSEVAPATAAMLHNLFLRADFPADLVQMLE